MDQLRAMRLFVRVAERGSFVAAATDLGLSHGMASATVKDLESALGVELIRRTTRRMSLTEEGLVYLDRARRILEEVDDLEETLGSRRRAISGQLVVQMPTAFARLVLAPSLGAFRQAYPGLDLSILSRDRFPDMVAENIDMLVYVGTIPDSGLVTRTLGTFPLVTAAAPSYLARRGRPEKIEALRDHDLIDMSSATTGRTLDWQFRIGSQRMLWPARAGLSFEHSEATISAAVSGAGIMQNISYALADHIAEGRLVPILSDYRDPGSDMHLLTRRYVTVPARVRVFASHLRQVAQERTVRDAAILAAADRAGIGGKEI
jgi:LysR family transcriptional regulator for bpeEF and oprC